MHAGRVRRDACASRSRAGCSRRPACPSTRSRAPPGFGTAETMRRAFARRVGAQPDRVPRPLPSGAARSGRLTRSRSMDIACSCSTASPRSTSIGPYEVLQRLPGARGEVRRRQSAGRSAPTTRCSGSSPTTPAPRSRAPTCSSCPAGSATRTLEHDEPHCSSGSARSTRRATWTTSVCTGSMLLGAAGSARGQAGDDALGVARPAARVRRDPDVGARRRAGQDRHRGRRVVGHRHGAARSRRASPATTSRRRSSSASSTTRSRRSTPARSPRPRVPSSISSAPPSRSGSREVSGD